MAHLKTGSTKTDLAATLTARGDAVVFRVDTTKDVVVVPSDDNPIPPHRPKPFSLLKGAQPVPPDGMQMAKPRSLLKGRNA